MMNMLGVTNKSLLQRDRGAFQASNHAEARALACITADPSAADSSLAAVTGPEVPDKLNPSSPFQAVFYNKAKVITGRGVSTSFSNTLPIELASDTFRTSRRAVLEGNSAIDLLRYPYKEPIAGRWTPANALFIAKNVVSLIELGIREVVWGDWKPISGYLFQLHKKPNARFFTDIIAGNASSQQLSSLGNMFADLLPGRTVLDLGCGDPRRAVSHRAIAQVLGAAQYVGVDVANIPNRNFRAEAFSNLPNSDSFEVRYHAGDFVAYLSEHQRQRPLFVCLEGIEVEEHDTAKLIGHSYLLEAMKKLGQLTQPGDVLYVGKIVSYIQPRASSEPTYDYYAECLSRTIDPADFGFRLVYGSVPACPSMESDARRIWIRE